MPKVSSTSFEDPLVGLGELAVWCECSTRRITQLVAEGHLDRAVSGKYRLRTSVRKLLQYYRAREQKGAARLGEDARLRAAQAGLRELELQEARGEVVAIDAVLALHRELLAKLNQAFSGSGSRLAPQVHGLASLAETKRRIDDELYAIQETFRSGLESLRSNSRGADRGDAAAQEAHA